VQGSHLQQVQGWQVQGSHLQHSHFADFSSAFVPQQPFPARTGWAPIASKTITGTVSVISVFFMTVSSVSF
jgi:hypothetical protein